MCLGIPGRVVELEPDDHVLMGKVEFGGIARRVCLEHVPEVRPGDYVLVHVGFALAVLDEQEARRVFELLEQAGADLGEWQRPDAEAATESGAKP